MKERECQLKEIRVSFSYSPDDQVMTGEGADDVGFILGRFQEVE